MGVPSSPEARRDHPQLSQALRRSDDDPPAVRPDPSLRSGLVGLSSIGRGDRQPVPDSCREIRVGMSCGARKSYLVSRVARSRDSGILLPGGFPSVVVRVACGVTRPPVGVAPTGSRPGESGPSPSTGGLHPDGTPPAAPAGRRFWSRLAWNWAGWREALVIVQPDTVVRWHRTAWRPLLDLEEPSPDAWSTVDPPRGPGAHSPHGAGEPPMGSRVHRR